MEKIMVDKIMPSLCPSCGRALSVVKLACGHCDTVVEGRFSLPVLARLDPAEQAFVVRFLRSSGSLKDLARHYGISYPTVRNRLDALIEKTEHLEAGAPEEER
jgi:hypothetical protein